MSIAGYISWGVYTEYHLRHEVKREVLQVLIRQSNMNDRLRQYDDSVEQAEYRAYWTKRMKEVKEGNYTDKK